MFIKQISVFLENRQGRLQELVSLLGDSGIDMIALSIADTTSFGILRAIVNDNQKAVELLRGSGYTAKLADVLAVAVPDSPGGLAGALAALKKCDVSIEYMYSFVRRVGQNAVLIFKVDAPEKAAEMLQKEGYHLLSEAEVIGG